MLSRKKNQLSSLKLNQTNIELNIAAKDDAKQSTVLLENATYSLFTPVKRHLSKRPSSARSETVNSRWQNVSSAYKTVSTDKDETKPKYIAYMSKSGAVSAETRKHVRPVTAQPCPTRTKKSGYLYHSVFRRRPSYSAGYDHGKRKSERDKIIARETMQIKERLTKKEPKSKSETEVDSLEPKFMTTRNRRSSSDLALETSFRNDPLSENRPDLALEDKVKGTDVIELNLKTDYEPTVNKIDADTGSQISAPDIQEDTDKATCQQKGVVVLSANMNKSSDVEFQSLSIAREKSNVVKLDREQRNYENILLLDKSNQEATGNEEQNKKTRLACLFRKASLFVRSILRLQTYMTDLSAEMTSRSATEEQWHAVNTSREVKEMAFNKAIFAKSKAVSKIPKWARTILAKPPDNRTDWDLRRLHALLRGLKSFDRFTEKIQLAMCRSFTYQWSTSGRIILRQGHVGQNFYFLYNGSVFVNIDDTDVQGNQFVKTEVVLKRGESFGELALLQDIKRTATISCREDCEMLVVDKDTFAKVCPRIFEEELEEKCDFLEKLDMFNPKLWTREALKKMCFEARIQEYKTNKVIVSDGSLDEWLYICMEGKCSVIRKLDLKEEIEWRKRRRREKDKRQAETDDVIDYMEIMGVKSFSTEANEDREHGSTNLKIGKERMLNSMGLDYTKTKRLSVDEINKSLPTKRSQNRGPKSAEEKMKTIQEEPPTLTALIAREKRNNILFLGIKTIGPNDIFNVYAILNQDCPIQLRNYILVSQGCRVLRIKQKSFFKEATTKAIYHARALSDLERYPDDEKLLQSYMEHLNWKVYKHSMLDKILRERDRKNRSTRHSEALNITAKKNARNVETLDALNQAFYEYDPNLRRIAKWKQMQEMAHNSPQGREVGEMELLTGIRMHGSLIPELQVDIHEEFSPKRSILSRGLLGFDSGFLAEDDREYLQGDDH